jgi:hypothetical protein
VGCGINVESKRELAIALKTCALIIALESLFAISITGARGETFGFGLEVLTTTRDEEPVLAGLVLFAGRWSVAAFFAGMTTRLLRLATRLLAMSSAILTFSRSMAELQAKMGPTTKLLHAYLPTSNIRQEAGLILQRLLSAHAGLFNQVRTFWAAFLIPMTIMRNLRMTTSLGSLAVKSARRW